MSKKDLLERLTRVPSDPVRPVRREEEPGPVRAPVEPGVQTRVGTRVVRRRPADEVPEPAPGPTVIRRRTVVVDEAAAEPTPRPGAPLRRPAEAPADAARPPARRLEDEASARSDAGRPDAPRAPEPKVEPTRVEPAPAEPKVEATPAAAAPEPARVEPVRPAAAVDAEAAKVEVAKVEAPKVEAPKVEVPKVEAAKVEAAEPAKAEAAKVEAANAAKGAPAKAEAPKAAPPKPEAPRAPTRVGVPDGTPPGAPDSPRYAGLGKAVVMPPPGYDPTNPAAFRRRQEAERGVDPRRGPAGPTSRRRPEAAPAGPDNRPPTFGPDARPGGGGPPGADARRRRGAAAPARVFERPGRPKRRKVAGQKAASPGPKAAKRKIKVDNVISVAQLAHELGVKAPVVIRHLMDLGMMASITQMLDMDTAALVAAEFEYEVENVGFQEQNYLEKVAEQSEEEGLVGRPPVVTIMGHVDHGKTTLLDTIRKSRVAAGEAGGITQHLGAYQVQSDSGPVTFIDTPGHEAFTAMRARGAQVTDIVVLVVAADDGVQPQTVEAIQHAKAAKVPIVVAVNKMDKPGVSMDAIMTRLSEHDLVPEQWGGTTMYAGVSALKGEGIDSLLETILLQAEVLDLRANPDRYAEGVVLEAKMERGRGAVATVLVQRGTLNRGDHVVLGSAYGKVRAIVDHTGHQMKSAPPSTPVELFGLSELPEVGDSVHAVKTEQNARALAEHRAQAKREIAMAESRKLTAADLYAKGSAAERVRFHMVLKADVGGSLQALKAAIEKIQVDGAECRILLTGIGDITESDVNLAASNGAHLLGFNVKLDAKARQAASQLGVEPEFFSVIYDLLDRVTRGLKGMLAPVIQRVRQGTVEVRQLFRISKVGVVAGSIVQDGKVARNHFVKVLRDGNLMYEGKVIGLKRFKEDVREVTAGFECGVSLDGFDEIAEGDVIETYSEEKVEAT